MSGQVAHMRSAVQLHAAFEAVHGERSA